MANTNWVKLRTRTATTSGSYVGMDLDPNFGTDIQEAWLYAEVYISSSLVADIVANSNSFTSSIMDFGGYAFGGDAARIFLQNVAGTAKWKSSSGTVLNPVIADTWMRCEVHYNANTGLIEFRIDGVDQGAIAGDTSSAFNAFSCNGPPLNQAHTGVTGTEFYAVDNIGYSLEGWIGEGAQPAYIWTFEGADPLNDANTNYPNPPFYAGFGNAPEVSFETGGIGPGPGLPGSAQFTDEFTSTSSWFFGPPGEFAPAEIAADFTNDAGLGANGFAGRLKFTRKPGDNGWAAQRQDFREGGDPSQVYWMSYAFALPTGFWALMEAAPSDYQGLPGFSQKVVSPITGYWWYPALQAPSGVGSGHLYAAVGSTDVLAVDLPEDIWHTVRQGLRLDGASSYYEWWVNDVQIDALTFNSGVTDGVMGPIIVDDHGVTSDVTVFIDAIHYLGVTGDPGNGDPPGRGSVLDANAGIVVEPLATILVDGIDITDCVLSGSVTRKLNKPWQATWRMPIDCSVNGTCSIVKIFFSGITDPWFTGRITQMSDECDEDFCYTEYTALDASELWAWRLVRDSTCDFSLPQIIEDNTTGPQIIEDALIQSESCDAGDPGFRDSEGPLFLDYGTFEGGGVDLTGAPVDWPMTIAELVGMLTDTGEVDVVLTPIDDPTNLARVDVYNGDYGTDLTATVKFEYGTGNNNCKIIRQVSDSTNVVNKLWYYLGPRVDTASDPQGVQHWTANVQGDDPDLPGNVSGGSGIGGAIPGRPSDVGGILGVRREDSQDACGIRMEVKIFDARGDEAIVSHELYRRLWQIESWLRAVPRTLVHVTPINTSTADLLPPGVTPVQVGDFDIGDLVTVSAGPVLRGGFTGAQRIYEYTVSWNEDAVVEIGELLTSADQEGR